MVYVVECDIWREGDYHHYSGYLIVNLFQMMQGNQPPVINISRVLKNRMAIQNMPNYIFKSYTLYKITARTDDDWYTLHCNEDNMLL